MQFLTALWDEFKNTRFFNFVSTSFIDYGEYINIVNLWRNSVTHNSNVLSFGYCNSVTPNPLIDSAQPCRQCGWTNHHVTQCKASLHVNGTHFWPPEHHGVMLLQHLPRLYVVLVIEELIILSLIVKLYIIPMEHGFLFHAQL